MILLTGANGFLGKYICTAIPAEQLCTLSRNDRQYAIDLSQSFSLPDIPFTTVIHAAGKAHCNPRNSREAQAFYDVNTQGTAHLLEALGARKTSIPEAFVFISTVAVYGVAQGTDITENHPLDATDPYGDSKIQAEKLVQDWCTLHNVRCTILRLPLLAGAQAPGNLGRMQQAILKGRYYNIAGGQARKSMVLAGNVAKVLMPLAAIGGIYNLTDGLHPTFGELSKVMAQQAGKRTPLSLPLWLARMLAAVGDRIPAFPFNTQTLVKMTGDLTFNDDNVRRTGLWQPDSVLDFYR